MDEKICVGRILESIQDSVENMTSIAVFDLQKGQEMIGVTLAKDLSYNPEGFEEKFIKDLNYISPCIAIEEKIIAEAQPEIQEILKQKTLVLDIWAVALKKEHMGKKLLNKMMLGNQLLAKKQGFKYGFCYATNFKTGLALHKLNYQNISQIDCKNFEYQGLKPFTLVQQINKKASIWLKKYQ